MSVIADFYKNKSIFLTGATGFVGKGVIDKLLRSCPGLVKLYILVRSKRGVDVAHRLKTLLDSSLFDTLKKENPDSLKKVVVVAGDVDLADLGMSEEDRATLCENVSIVIHSAATVKFDEELKVSVNTNVCGIQRIIRFCREMKHLVGLIHVSTAFANCEEKYSQELVRPLPFHPVKFIQMIQGLEDKIVKSITSDLIGKKPNTYTFTKAMGEHLLGEEDTVLPICIIRPSIVAATYQDPVAGWVDNLNASTGIMAATGRGILRTVKGHEKNRMGIIPLDYLVNLIIAAAWEVGSGPTKRVKVFNCCTSQRNPIFWGTIIRYALTSFISNPFSGLLRYPSLTLNRRFVTLCEFRVHYFPAFVMDIIAQVFGRKPIMLKINKKLKKTVMALEYFYMHDWDFKSDNMQALYDQMCPQDKKSFTLNVQELNWKNYIEDYCLGIRHYVFKEDPNSLDAALKHLSVVYCVEQAINLCFIVLFCFIMFLLIGR